MIGQLINEFESRGAQTVSVFNEIFDYCTLTDYPYDAEVEIGCIAGCDKIREIRINGKKTYHEFLVEGSPANVNMGNKKSDRKLEIFNADGESIGQFLGMVVAASKLGISHTTLYRYERNGVYIIEDVA